MMDLIARVLALSLVSPGAAASLGGEDGVLSFKGSGMTGGRRFYNRNPSTGVLVKYLKTPSGLGALYDMLLHCRCILRWDLCCPVLSWELWHVRKREPIQARAAGEIDQQSRWPR